MEKRTIEWNNMITNGRTRNLKTDKQLRTDSHGQTTTNRQPRTDSHRPFYRAITIMMSEFFVSIIKNANEFLNGFDKIRIVERRLSINQSSMRNVHRAYVRLSESITIGVEIGIDLCLPWIFVLQSWAFVPIFVFFLECHWFLHGLSSSDGNRIRTESQHVPCVNFSTMEIPAVHEVPFEVEEEIVCNTHCAVWYITAWF